MIPVLEITLRYYLIICTLLSLALLFRASYYYRLHKNDEYYDAMRETQDHEVNEQCSKWISFIFFVYLGFFFAALAMMWAHLYVMRTDYRGWGHIPWESTVWKAEMFIKMLVHILYGLAWTVISVISIALGIKTLFMSKRQIMEKQ